MGFNIGGIVKVNASTVLALSGVTANTVTSSAALILVPNEITKMAMESLVMNVTAGITTSTLVVTTVWQVSENGSTWVTLYPMNGAAYVNVAAAGNGSLVTTNYVQGCLGWNPSKQYLRAAVISTVTTGGAGDNVTISYGWRKAELSLPA
jgi:hypothetical protein